MGRTSLTGGVIAVAISRIRFDFTFEGMRYRPSLQIAPTEMNLRNARVCLKGIKQRISQGTFSFAEEFPEYRFLSKTPAEGLPRTCNQVFDAFLAHCEARLAKRDLAAVTVTSYRRIIDRFWRPRIGIMRFLEVRHSTLVALADAPSWSKKTYNNALSVLRRAFKFGYRDYPEKHNPTLSLVSAHRTKRDRATIDPFTIQEAETLIAAIHQDWGEARGNYDEFRFFTGLRPSEEIALVLDDFDAARGTLRINKARVAGVDKVSTKTGEDRCLVLCGRALQVLNRQLQLRVRLVAAGQIHHDHLFFTATGAPIIHLRHPYTRWRHTLQRLSVRYRKPYGARHSSVSWNLMIGKNPLWVAKQHGHTITTMLRAYAAWSVGATETDIAAIERAMQDVGATRFGSGFGSSHYQRSAKCSNRWALIGGKGGIGIGENSG